MKREDQELISRKDRKTGALAKVPKAVSIPLLAKDRVAAWLGCSVSRVEHIESGSPKLRLSPEDAQILAAQTGVSFAWLMDNDVSKPIINSHGKPYTLADFENRQMELKKTSFKNPVSNRDIWRVINSLGEMFGMIAAATLRSVEKGDFDVLDYKLRAAINNLYGKRDTLMVDLIFKSVYYGKPTITRPDTSALLDEWEIKFKEIIASKTGDKLPIAPRKIESLPAVYPRRAKRKKPPVKAG